jgi:hypothetical protein
MPKNNPLTIRVDRIPSPPFSVVYICIPSSISIKEQCPKSVLGKRSIKPLLTGKKSFVLLGN